MTNHRHISTPFVLAIITIAAIMGCANRGAGPQGGAKDTTPPQLKKTKPENNSTNITSPIVELTFDEIVQIKNPFEKVVISPPQTTPADIKALGHKIKVTLKDSLLDSTTYTIDFTDAIVDNNEGNILDGLSFGFSTSDHIDSLTMAGSIIDAATLNPVPGIIVGIQKDTHDTAFTTTPFRRITKTNANGQFTVRNIAHGSYRIYALKDMGNNYFFDLPTERIAFTDSIYTPTATVSTVFDTIGHFYTDTITGTVDSTQFITDTIISRDVTTFTPSDIVLKSFIERDFRYYLTRNERPERNYFRLLFSSQSDTLPTIRPLNIDSTAFAYIISKNANADTLTYWLTDSTAIKTDTIKIELSYRRIDLDSQYTRIDTLNLLYRQPRNNTKSGFGSKTSTRSTNNSQRKNSTKTTAQDTVASPDSTALTPQTPPRPKLNISHNASQTFDVYLPLTVTSPLPTWYNDTAHYIVEQKVDTLFHPIDATLSRADSIGLKYNINYPWQPETTYRITLDSALFIAIDSSVNYKTQASFTTKSLEQYGKLIFTIKNYQGNEVIQLLNKNDAVVRTIPTTQATTTIEYITPDVYYARLFIDLNGNHLWDTGNYRQHLQPEEVFYFPYEIEIRAFWDVEEDWDIHELPILNQKPAELVKPITDTK